MRAPNNGDDRPAANQPSSDDLGAAAPGGPDERTEVLVIVREPDAHGGLLIESALERALASAGTRPAGARTVLAAGADPLTDPQAYGAEILAHSGATAVLFRAEHTRVLYSTWRASLAPGRAARNHGAFAEIVVGVLEAVRPRVVLMADLRLVTRRDGGARIVDALCRCADRLLCHGFVAFDTSAPFGRLMLSTMTTLAEIERDSTAWRRRVSLRAATRPQARPPASPDPDGTPNGGGRS